MLARTILSSLILTGACLSQARAPVDATTKLIEEIEVFASAEPPLLGIDTQIEAARILQKVRPAASKRFVERALSRIRPLTDPFTVRALLYPAIEVLYLVDPEEAAQTVSAQMLLIRSRKPVREDALLLKGLAELAKETHPELARSCAAESERILKPDKKKDSESSTPRPKWPDTNDKTSEEIIALARQQKDPLVRIEMFISVIDDKESTPRRRSALAAEVLPDTEKLPVGSDDRLLSQSMLTRRLYEAGDMPGAALAAQMLEQTFIKMFDCESAACTSFKGETSPGEMVRAFAEYLDENKIDPAGIGLTHRSLRVRMMLIRLKKSLEGNNEG